MHFSTSIMAVLASVAAVNAGQITFKSQDAKSRQIFFVPDPNSAPIGPITVPGNQNKPVAVPAGWSGMFYAVQEGEENKGLGMLGEITMKGGVDEHAFTSFDVSAIDDTTDTNNVKQLYSATGTGPVAGCENYIEDPEPHQECDSAYYRPHDVQTQTTPSDELICTLGGGDNGSSS